MIPLLNVLPHKNSRFQQNFNVGIACLKNTKISVLRFYIYSAIISWHFHKVGSFDEELNIGITKEIVSELKIEGISGHSAMIEMLLSV